MMNLSDWLLAMPLPDNPFVQGSEQRFGTWEEWVRQGKVIENLEEGLLRTLDNEKEPYRRSLVLLALGSVGTELSVTSLIKRLQSDVALVQMEAAASLGHLGKPVALNALSEALKNHDPNVRANACTALGRLGGTKAKNALFAALNDKDPFVRAVAKEALGTYKGQRAGRKYSIFSASLL